MKNRDNPSVLFYLQHLLGVGHVFRATRIARAMVRAGMNVHIAWGGAAVPSVDLAGIDVTWLEPLRAADPEITCLVDRNGNVADETLKAGRRRRLLELLDRLRPDIVVTETFPFGRSKLHFELLPFMEAVAAAPWRPMAVSTIRDILRENRKERRARESIEWAKAWYDLILVHGDPALIPIEQTLQYAHEVMDKIRYTGLVAPDPPDRNSAPSVTARVVVSVGGGALLGRTLADAALEAPSRSALFPDGWLLIAGPERDEAEFAALRERAGKGLRVVRFVPDLARVLADAEISVSRAGYNTVADVMRAGCRPVIVPFENDANVAGIETETEQLRRAEILAHRGYAIMLRNAGLNASALAAAVDRAARLPPMKVDFDLDGARNAARIILEAWKGRGNS